MVELVNLLEDCPEGFYKLVNDEGYDLLKSGDCVAIGVTDDDVPAGAIVADPGYEGVGEIVSLYVTPSKRRRGFASTMFYEAVDMLYDFDNMYAVGASFSGAEENGLKEFFEFLEFDIEKDDTHGTLSFTLSDIAASDKVKGDIDKRVVSLKDALSSTKNALIARHEAVQTFLAYGEIDEEISCIVNAEDKEPSDLSCLFVGKSEDSLVIAWAQSAEMSLDLINMLRFAIVNGLKKYGKDMVVRVPYINETSKKLIEKLVGDKAESVETVWSAYLPLEWDLEEETD